jgi:hypothetical protein
MVDIVQSSVLCAISCHADIVLVQISIRESMFIKLIGGMTMLVYRVGVSPLGSFRMPLSLQVQLHIE